MRLERFWNGVKKERGGVEREKKKLNRVKIIYQTCFLFYYYFLTN